MNKSLISIIRADPAPKVEISVCRPSHAPQAEKLPERYVPSVQRCALELGLRQTIDLRESIQRTIA